MSAKPVDSAVSVLATSKEDTPRPPSSSHTPHNSSQSTILPYTASAAITIKIPPKKKPH